MLFSAQNNNYSNKEVSYNKPMNSILFIDLEDGDEVEFLTDTDPIGFVWNNQYRFYKVEL